MTQPEALRLADDLVKYLGGNTATQAAAELRRLYRVSEDLIESLNHKSYYQARLTKHMREMKVQRDELLAALKLMLASHDATFPGEECQLSGVDLARAAIAKAQQ